VNKAQGTQSWRHLLFSHWEVPVEVLRPKIHPRLSIDTFEGRAFVGVVAFAMRAVKPFGFAVPTATNFFEINLRTYVTVEGREPGVVFFSLDANSTLATLGARSLWHMPYHRARISYEQGRWTCDRRWPGPPMRGFRAEVEVGEPLPPSQPGSLEFFLAERYQFYAGQPLRRGRIRHSPYPLHAVKSANVNGALLEAAGLPSAGARTPDYFSQGVDVEMFALEKVS
jgi:uncharacterized protein YqjF (DUF2071 family)